MFAQASSLEAFPTIKLETPECAAWARYFEQHLGGKPWAYKALMRGEILEMTVPTQWPEWFDSSFVSGT